MYFNDIEAHKINYLKNVSYIVEWKIKLMFFVTTFRI